MSFSVPVNNPVLATVQFVDQSSNPIDPVSGIEIIVRDPSGAIATYTYGGLGTVVKNSVGNYSVVFEVVLEGPHYARGQGVLASGSTVTTADAPVIGTPSQA